MELVGRAEAPFGGRDAGPGPVSALLLPRAPHLGFFAAQFGSATELLGFFAVLLVLGSVSFLLVPYPVAFLFGPGPVAGIPVGAANVLVERSRAKLRRRELAEVRRWWRLARNGRPIRVVPGVGRWRSPPLTGPPG